MFPKLRKTYTTLKCDLRISTELNGKIFYNENRKIYEFDPCTNNTELISENIEAERMIGYKTDLLVFSNNIVSVITKSGYLIKKIYLSEVPKRFISHFQDKFICFLYDNHDFFEIITNDYELRKIRIIGRKNFEIIDMCFSDNNCYALANNGSIYECENFIRSNRLKLEKELKKLIEKEVLFDQKSPNKIIYAHDMFFLCYNNGFEVLNKSFDLLKPVYYYKSDYDACDIYFFDNIVYFKSEKLFILDEYPLQIIDKNIKHFFKHIAIAEDSIIFIDGLFDSKCTEKMTEGLFLSETNPNKRVDSLFGFILDKMQTSEPIKENINSEISLIKFKHDVNDFKANYTDKLRIVLLELKSVQKKSFDMYNEIKLIEEDIKQRLRIYDEKKKRIIKDYKEINFVLTKVCKNKNISLIPNFKDRVAECRLKISTLKTKNDKKTIDILKVQRTLLRSFLTKNKNF